MRKSILFIYAILVCLLNEATGQYFEHLDINKGLSSASINAIEKDSLGFVWFASANGLDRFSGSDFKHYDLSMETLMPYDKDVMSVKNIQGDLWVTLRSGNLLKYDYLKDKFRFLASKENFQFRDILNISERKLLITGTGILFYDKLKNEIEEVYREEDNYFRTPITIDDKLYVASNKGVYVFRTDSSQAIFEKRILDNEYIQTLDLLDKQLLVGTSEKGLYHLDHDGKIINQISFGYGENVQSINCVDSVIYIGVNRIGLIVIDDNFNFKSTYSHDSDDDNSLSINSIHDIYIDDENRIWISTYRKGVDVLDPHNKPFSILQHEKNTTNSLHNNVVRSICEISPDEIWFGTERGISTYDPGKDQWRLIDPLLNDAVLQIRKWRDYLAVSTFGAGLVLVDPVSHQVVKTYTSDNGVNDFIYNSCVDDRQNLWFAGLENLYRIDSLFRVESFPVKNIKSMVQHNDGTLLLGTFHGIFSIDQDGQVLPAFPKLGNDLIWSMYKNDPILWIGTEGAGLKSINTHTGEERKIQSVSSKMIFDIYQDDDQNLWLLTSKGIGKYDVLKDNYTLYSMHDNLPTNDFRLGKIVKTNTGKLLICSSFGVVEFYPHEIEDYTEPTNVFITKLDISGNSFSDRSTLLLDNLDLRYNENNLSFTFESTGITNWKSSLYRWMLIGYDKDWVTSENRTVSYSNLSPGRYQLRYLAANRDGIWMQQPKVLDIFIKPPIWASLWAKIAYVILFMGVIGLMFYLYRINLNRRYSDDKIRSFINIAHDINNMISVIKLSAEKITHGMPENHSTKLLLQNSNRLSNWAEQLISFQKAERGKLKMEIEEVSLIPFLKHIAEGFSPLLEKKQIKIECDLQPAHLWFDPNLMVRVINNLLSNAIKYSPDFGKIILSTEDKDEHLVISIRDEGIGIPKKDQKEIFKRFYQSENNREIHQYEGSGIGLMLSKHIVTMHHGQIDFESERGKGSRFNVYLQKGNSHYEEDQVIYGKTEDNRKVEDVDLTEFSAKHILLIDDNDEFRSSLKEQLSGVFKITEARNGEEGIMKASELLPDLIISDIMMPKVSGSELCYRLKNDEATSHLPIIILTSLASAQDKVENLEYGADAYIEKPVNIRLLQITLRNILLAQERLRKYHNIAEQEVKQKPKLPATENAFLGKVATIVKRQLTNNNAVDIDDIVSDLGLSRSAFYRKMKSITHLSPAAFIQKVRLLYAADLLTNSKHLNIMEIAYKCGFVNSKHFSVSFRKEFGTTPTSYRKQQNEKKIRPE